MFGRKTKLMAKTKSIGELRKLNFGKRKGGKAVKSYNKHHSKSTYKIRQGSKN